jgi:hypothetical protein
VAARQGDGRHAGINGPRAAWFTPPAAEPGRARLRRHW